MSIGLPTTPTARAALDVATRFCSPALLNHSVRSYLWGVAYANAHDVAFDDELYFVSAMLHDIGLTTPFDSHTVPFEEAGGHLAWAFGIAAGWPADRSARADEIIVRHMRKDVPATEDPESHLLQVATSWDVSGRRATEFPTALRAEVLEAYPRLDFGAQFVELFKDQTERKPGSAAAQATNGGIAARISANPLDH
ncbi:HD domain-containing protein [Catellatospora sp. TT07R-123]|uniref:HD domain-containing protein n=1 Tax=Catellatospora sp. TT07R-123 TaxID=2733863 RepID=UPI001BB3A43D|nr:HD domain-containing protein [Catellatospora sp. TT07R-123]